MASTYLTDTQGTPTDNNKWTFSTWIKKSAIGTGEGWIFVAYANSTNMTGLRMNGSGDNHSLNFWDYQSGDGGYTGRLVTNRSFRDCSGWYNIVVVWDSDNATAGDRMKMYINGVEETSFSTDTNPSSGQSTVMNTNAQVLTIGGNTAEGSYYDGLMSHIHFSDGYVYPASTFGSTDATTGEWKINTSPSFTLGTNGFTILKDGNTITDQSTNSNDFALGGGTLTNTEDNPSDVFATLNPLQTPTSNPPTYSNGNTTSISSTTSGSYKWGGATTLGMTKGKYYCEAKATIDPTYSRNVLGVTGNAADIARNNGSFYAVDYGSGWYSSDGVIKINTSTGYTASTYATGDILSIAIDLDNLKLYYAKAGTWENSGDPTSGATGTGALTLTAVADTPDGAYFFAQCDDTGTTSPSKFDFNFGNGYFGTTAITSEGTNASNIGKFEYDVPTGYTALSTKGFNE